MATVTDYTALLAINDEADARWNGIAKLGKPVIVTYSFADESNVPKVDESLFDVTSTSAFTTGQRANFRKAIAAYEAVTGVLFVEIAEGGMIDVSNADGSEYGGWANYAESSQNYTGKGVLVVDSDNGDYNIGTYGYLTMLHEVGHALGLQHPHDGSVLLADAYDIQSNTVMTYNNTEPYAVGLGVFDVQALQHLYGAKADSSDWAVSYNDANNVLRVVAGGADDFILGVAGDNDLRGGDGDDVLLGREDSDTLSGGEGHDILKGMNGSDTLFGRDGDDTLIGDAKGSSFFHGQDVLFGGGGNDTLVGYYNLDSLYGGHGDDALFGGNSNDKMMGGAGADLLEGGSGNDVMMGGGGNDRLFGRSGDDSLFGGKGDDRLADFTGSNLFDGGKGNDIIRSGYSRDTFFVRDDSGDDRIINFAAEYGLIHFVGRNMAIGDLQFIAKNGGKDTLVKFADTGSSVYLKGVATGALSSKNFIFNGATSNDDVFYGNADSNTLLGAAGDDILYGRQGVDNLFGGKGTDTMFGGAGNDDLFGGDSKDILYGGGGDDRLFGGSGNDLLVGGGGADIFVIDGSSEIDRVRDFQIGQDKIDLREIPVGYSGLLFSKANGGADTRVSNKVTDLSLYLKGVEKTELSESDFLLYSVPMELEVIGDDSANTLYGGALNDTLYGLGGDDRLFGGVDGSDTIFGGDGNDFLETSTQNNFFASNLYGGAGDDTLLMGSFSGQLYGGDGSDILRVVGRNNETYAFFGGAGADSIYGGAGFASHYYGGRGDDFFNISKTFYEDTFYFDDNSGNDRIVGFQISEDLIDFSDSSISYDDLTFTDSNGGRDTLIQAVGFDVSIYLDGIATSSLSQSELVF